MPRFSGSHYPAALLGTGELEMKHAVASSPVPSLCLAPVAPELLAGCQGPQEQDTSVPAVQPNHFQMPQTWPLVSA